MNTQLFNPGQLILLKNGSFTVEIEVGDSCFVKYLNARKMVDYIYAHREEIIDESENNGAIVRRSINYLNDSIEITNNSYSDLKILEEFFDQYADMYEFLHETMKVDELINAD